jgi:subtilisin family serine protease
MLQLRSLVLSLGLFAANVAAQMVGINVLLNTPPTPAVLSQVGAHGDVLDVIPEINAITVRATVEALAAISALPCVAAACLDQECELARVSDVTGPDFANGASQWGLDAINVTDYGTTRTVSYDGSGVYIAVIDSGLPHNWREYFPEERIASQFGISFSGGGGEASTISTQTENWDHDMDGHGTQIVSVLLGFSYYGTQIYNGVAPRANIIPVKTAHNLHGGRSSVNTRAIIYLANLKASGALGNAPLVINMSWGGFAPDPVQRAALVYAIAQGVIAVACAGNEGAGGMRWPAAYPEVISVAAFGWTSQFPANDPSTYLWNFLDFPESDPLAYYIPGWSSREHVGQDLDIAAPTMVGSGFSRNNGQVDYTFFLGTSASCPHVAGVAALMLQKNSTLTQAQIETILESTAMPLAPGCRMTNTPVGFTGNLPTWSDHGSLVFALLNECWQSDATGHGALRADAALAATPIP